MKRGRPSRIDKKLTRQFCDLFREGFGITTICAALNVSESKFHEWMKKGEQGEQPYAEFRQRTLCARAWGKIEHLRHIFASKDWRGRAWYLERTHPLEFGRSAERPLPKEPESQPQKPLIEFSIRLRDGTRIPTTFQEAEKMFADFPIVETPEELAKNDDDELGSNEDESGFSPNQYPNESPS